MVLVDGEAEDKLSNQCKLNMWSSHHDSDAFYFVKNAFLRERPHLFLEINILLARQKKHDVNGASHNQAHMPV